MITITTMILTVFAVFFQDDFNDGNADGWYTVGPSDYTVENGRYHFSGGGAVNDATSYRGDLGTTMSTGDYSITSDVEIDVGTFGGALVRYDEEGEYNLMLVIGLPQQSLRLYRWYWSTIELLDAHPMTVEQGETYRFTFQCEGSTFAGRAWLKGEPEPDVWHVSAQDTVSRNGAAALFAAGVFKGSSLVYLSCYFDNVIVDVPEPWSFQSTTWAGLKSLF